MDKISEIKERFNEDEIERDDMEWLIEQVEKAAQYKIALKNISDILEGQNVTELIERIAYELAHSGIYDKE
ncbi:MULTISPECIES: hypothetical protein [Bacillus]|uniref:hypothetical protein n=1 Tax=Bacillus TaxID=1386 RepID=UPI0009497499|nr:hypothetical protein [Bacillus licheniformis]AVI45411.1 hypothetical protein BL14DL4_00143 [Bacillus licheniformis]MED1659491.1 hypothetical protein [Bacillus licheniformis]MED7755601.1 hypothetical protein [Bacillus licheniformis]OLF88773.1 hypothetical protein B4094_3483 [Bacillus licheniformis]PAC91469.1 hypothetical protein CHH99_17070 [Bacillus licheniformis]